MQRNLEPQQDPQQHQIPSTNRPKHGPTRPARRQYDPSLPDEPEDVWGPFKQFGFDFQNLQLANSHILKSPQGEFYQIEKIVPLPSRNPYALDAVPFEPLPNLPHQQPSEQSRQKPYGNWPKQGGPSFPTSDDPDDESDFAPATTSATGFGKNFRHDSKGMLPTLGRELPARTVQGAPPQDRRRKTHPSDLQWPNEEPSPFYALEAPQERRSMAHSTRTARLERQSPQTLRTSRDSEMLQEIYTNSLPSGLSCGPYGAQRPTNQPEQGYVAQARPPWPPAAPSSNLASPFSRHLDVSLQYRQRNCHNPGASGAGSGTMLSQGPPTTNVIPGEFSAYSSENRVPATIPLPSSPESVIDSRSSDEAANAPIYVGSDTSTTGSDRISHGTVSPGEVLVFEGDVRQSKAFRAPFQPALLKIFRNTLNGELRFYSKALTTSGNDTGTFKMRQSETELVPTYAYDISKGNVLYLREISRNKFGSFQTHSAVYEFPTLKNLVLFQGKMLEEEVELDLESLRFVNLVERGNRQRRIDFARLQIWHEASQGPRRSDSGSIMTAGTVLSGPLKDRTSPSCSRVLLFLGRSEEYLSFFVTDDITLKQASPTSIRLHATKYSGKDILISRTGVKCLHVKRTDVAAGIPLSKKGFDPNDEDSFDQFKSLEFEFENDESLQSFWETWDILIRRRREQRLSIQDVRRSMSQRVYYGPIATRLL